MGGKHDKQKSMKGLACGGKVAMAKGGAVRRDGCASKGKTKGRVC